MATPFMIAPLPSTDCPRAARPPAWQPRTELTDGEVEAFDRVGYHIHEPLFTIDEVEDLRLACERVAQRRYRTGIAPDARGWEPDFPALAVCKTGTRAPAIASRWCRT